MNIEDKTLKLQRPSYSRRKESMKRRKRRVDKVVREDGPVSENERRYPDVDQTPKLDDSTRI